MSKKLTHNELIIAYLMEFGTITPPSEIDGF